MAHLKTDSGSNAHFARVPYISKSRNTFAIAEKHITTTQFDKLYPVYHKFIQPGDTLNIIHAHLARLATQKFTLFDDIYLDFQAWFVPHRLTQTNWSRFQFNDQPDNPGQNNAVLTTPFIDLSVGLGSGFASKSLYDYFDIPTLVTPSATENHINAYMFRAYNLIWNNNYRDENLQNARAVLLGETIGDPVTNYIIMPRGKRHDMFTSGLGSQQKGPAAAMGFIGNVPVQRTSAAAGPLTMYATGSNTPSGASVPLQLNGGGNIIGNDGIVRTFDPNGSLYINSSALSFTVNAFRSSVAVQHLLESDARGGTRDVEAIQHRYGVTVPDFRLSKPEYLGGATFNLDGHVVPQTSETGTTPQANLAQFSQSLNSWKINHSFQEHGCFMILASARGNITYQQGLAKEYQYKTRYDFPQPEFFNIGEVAVKNSEIFFAGTANDNNTFVFQEYGYELRYGKNRVSAEMRSNFPTSKDGYHLADEYLTAPTYTDAWIQSNTPIERNIVVSPALADPLEWSFFTKGSITRVLPMYSVPGLTRL